MAEIGATLREARMRARIDISEIEAQTKIRAKYLRALENEEWDLLPGPTYVKSFLRTYADALGLDGKRLVEEYKLSNERLSDVELQPIAPRGSREQRRTRRGLGRGWVIAVAVIALVAALYVLGRDTSTDDQPASDTGTVTTTTQANTHKRHRRHRQAAAATKPSRVRLALTPSAPVWVCLVSGSGQELIPGTTLQPGATQTFRSKRMTMTLGNSSLTLTVNGKATNVPASAEPLGYSLTPGKGLQELPATERPTCGQ